MPLSHPVDPSAVFAALQSRIAADALQIAGLTVTVNSLESQVEELTGQRDRLLDEIVTFQKQNPDA